MFSAILVVFLFFARHELLFSGNLRLVDTQAALGIWRSINHPLRLINFAAFAYIIWYLPRSVDEKLERLFPVRWLRFLGRHSLQVFAWSVLA